MNNLVRSPAPGTRDGNWMWDGTRWVCDPDCDGPPGPPCLPWQPQPPWFPPPATSPPWYPGGNAGVSFSPPGSPPPNPIRGNFWWDGTALWMFDGAAWVAVGGAGATGTPPSTTAPANPQPGQQWFNGTTLFVWDGNAWVPVSQTKTSIQPTAPPAPNPGDLWFDGTQLRIWSGSAWMLVGPGATVGPVGTTTKVFEVGTTSASTIAAAGTAEIALINGTPTINTGGAWDINNHTYTPNRAGTYNFEISSFNTSADYVAIYLIKNDSGFPLNVSGSQFICIDETTSTTWMSTGGMVQMNGSTDFVRLWWQAGVAGATWPASGAGIPNIRAFLLP